jgi:uncharacterized protein YdhG (YjbR/CyaY superfamily)
MVEKNKYLDLENGDDFGFTFQEETDLTPITDEVADLKERLQAIRKIYLPLLQNLAKNADQPVIKWPDRGPMLKKQIDKMVMLTEPGFSDGAK